MSQARINVIKGGAEKYRTDGRKSVACVSNCDSIHAEETRALFLEMRRLMIRLVKSIENTYNLRESDLKSE